MGQPPWADWPLWSIEDHGWKAAVLPPLARAISLELPRWNICDGTDWPNYRAVSAEWGYEAHKAGVPISAIRLWFQVGRAVDADYYRSRAEWNRMPSVPPIQ